MMRWRSAALLTCLSIMAAGAIALAQEPPRQVTAGKEYDTSGSQRFWFGDGYRDVWAAPFEAPVLDLTKESGGLEPVRQVGGLQTPGLAMKGADGRSYTFRSLHKEPERLLPPEWRESWPAKMIRDATSGTHPGAAVMLPVLAEAAGIPHTQPRLVIMPDDPKLANFRATFANQLGTFEEYPTAGSDGREGFQGATEIIATSELWERWLKGPENRIDTRAFLRARILDLFVDNYDRRKGQWRWMRVPSNPLWVALPEDPDMAFLRRDGVVNAAMRQHRPQLLEFSEDYPGSLEGPTLLASEVDRWLLSNVELEVYREVARDLQSKWTDAVLEKVVAQLPPEWRALDNGALVRAMKARRNELVSYVERFYYYLAQRVDIHLTNQSELVTISSPAVRQLTVKASVAGAEPHFARTFHSDDTKEIRVYVHGGDDRIERNGRGTSITVRVVANEGTKTVESPNRRTEVWKGTGQVIGEKVAKRDLWVNPAPVEGAPWIEPRDYGATTIVMPAAWYASDFGFVLGANLTRTTYGFRSFPSAKKQTLRGGFAFGSNTGKLDYHGLFARPASSIALDLRAMGSGIEHINYFGLGNDTPEQPRELYRSRQTLISVAPSLRLGSSPRLQATVGPEFRRSRADDDDSTLLTLQDPYGTGVFRSLRFRGTFEADTRHLPSANLMDLASGTNGESADQPPGTGIRIRGSAYVAPRTFDVKETYGGVEGMVVAYVGSPDVQLALRVGGERLFKTYPYFDAASIGGVTNRGFRSDRFIGDSSIFGNAEFRAYLTHPKYQSIFPVRFGIIGFADAGRVWLSGENSNTWHGSGGGGVLVKPVGTPMVFRAVASFSKEGRLFYVGSGFRF